MLGGVTGIRGGPARTIIGLIRGALPALAVATIIPLCLFYLAMMLRSVDTAIVVSVVYAYSVGLWQLRRRRRVSGMLLITMFTVTIKGVAVLASGQPFFYFLAPVIETMGFGLLFVGSLLSRESLIVRLARDVVPCVAEDLAERTCFCRLLSVVWAVTYLGSGVTTFFLLISQPVAVYMAAHQLTGWAWDGIGLAASLLLCQWRAQGLLAAAKEHFRVDRPAGPVLPVLHVLPGVEPVALAPVAV
jgi:intracellular septation protein A